MLSNSYSKLVLLLMANNLDSTIMRLLALLLNLTGVTDNF